MGNRPGAIAILEPGAYFRSNLRLGGVHAISKSKGNRATLEKALQSTDYFWKMER
jgi:hypothetical protein